MRKIELEPLNETAIMGGHESKDARVEIEEQEPHVHAKDPEDCSVQNVGPLTKVLRLIGASVLVASASIFLFQNWESGNDIQRYMTLLAHTALLPISAFFCGLRIFEKKGARTLLALTLAIIPIHYAVLSGMVYSQWALDKITMAVPDFALWVAPSGLAAILVTAFASVILLPLSGVSILSLARSEVKALTLVYICTNLLLLIPLRESRIMAMVILAVVVVLTLFEIRRWQHRSDLKTFEGRWVRAMVWAPVMLLVARTFRIYEISAVFSAALWASVAVLLFILGPSISRSKAAQIAMQSGSVIPTGISWYTLVMHLYPRLDMPAEVVLPLLGIPFATILWGMSIYCIGDSSVYRRLATFVALTAVAADLVIYPGALSSFCCLVVAVGGLTFGYIAKQKLTFVAGIFSALLALGYHIRFAILHYSLPYWVALSVLGVGIIIIASIVERHFVELMRRVKLFQQGLDNQS